MFETQSCNPNIVGAQRFADFAKLAVDPSVNFGCFFAQLEHGNIRGVQQIGQKRLVELFPPASFESSSQLGNYDQRDEDFIFRIDESFEIVSAAIKGGVGTSVNNVFQDHSSSSIADCPLTA